MKDAGILEGDFVVVRPTERARDGEIVVALVGDEEATVKRFFREKDQVRLQPENKSMKPIRSRDVRVLGPRRRESSGGFRDHALAVRRRETPPVRAVRGDA